MRIRKSCRALLAAALCLALTACQSAGVPIQAAEPVALPTARMRVAAPIGDAALSYTRAATLYLPRHDGERLTALSTEISFSASALYAETLVRRLLEHGGNGYVSSLGAGARLDLYGANPVELSRDVATVNLAASALQLDRKTYYLACQAIANTLTELSGIQYVNVQVADRQIGLDIANTLPTGAFARSVGENAGAQYEQMLSQRVQADEDAAVRRLSSVITLYFPLSARDGVMSEARSVAFENQLLPDMIERVLQELASGPSQSVASPALPLLAELLLQPPEAEEPAGGAGRVITLRFDEALDDMLLARGVTRASVMASLCYTLCTFLPNVRGLAVYIGDELVENVRLTGGAAAGIIFEDSVQRRSDYAALLMDECALFFADEAGEKLVAVRRPVPFYQARSPRALLLELVRGPQRYDDRSDVSPVLPPEALRDADILGLSLNDRLLCVHFSNAFAGVGEAIEPRADRLLAFALVNTLCALEPVSSVAFFVAGEQLKRFTDEIDWAGVFYPSEGLSR